MRAIVTTIREITMRTALAGIVLAALAARGAAAAAPTPMTPEVRHEVEYLKAVNAAGPPRDPQLLLLLVAQLANANRQAEGVEFLSARLKAFDAQLADPQRALYLAAIASLRAPLTAARPPAQRLVWARETRRLLDEAKRLTGGQAFIIRWFSATAAIDDGEAAADLDWCIEHAREAPNPGLLRPVYLKLAGIQRRRGDTARASELLRLGGGTEGEPPVNLTSPASIDPATGLPVLPTAIIDVVPGKIFRLAGFDFADFAFVVSEDRRELIAV